MKANGNFSIWLARLRDPTIPESSLMAVSWASVLSDAAPVIDMILHNVGRLSQSSNIFGARVSPRLHSLQEY